MKFIRAITLILVFAIAGFLIGAWMSSLSIEKPSGLAGPGIVVGTGFFSAIGGILISLIILAKASVKKVVIIIVVVGTLVALTILFLLGRYQRDNKAVPEGPSKSTTKPITQLILFQPSVLDMGIGMVYPNVYSAEVLYFYNPNVEKSVDEHTPIDSLVFVKTELGIDISYAPPWFYPEHMKIDYELLILKGMSSTGDWMKVEVNKQTHQTAWIDATKVKWTSWPEFLLKVNSVDPIDASQNPLRVKPLTHASIKKYPKGVLYKPIEVTSQWIQVKVLDSEYQQVGEGWIKWRDGNQLIISYSLLS